MAAITGAIIGAIGVATSAFGLMESMEAGEKQDDAFGAKAAVDAKISAQSVKAEKARHEAAQFSSMRDRRKLLQQYSVQSALAKSRAVSGGQSAAAGQQSSAYGGAQAQLKSQTGEGLGASFTQEGFSDRIFAANLASFGLGVQGSAIGTQINSLSRDIDWGKTLFTIGSDVTGNAEKAGKVTNATFGLKQVI
jgi:hypothetical protein